MMSSEEENKKAGRPEVSGPETPERNISEEQSASIPIIEEELKLAKERVETGKVRISKKVHEEEEIIELPESHEEVHIERVPFNKFLDSGPPPVRQEGDTTIYPVLKEVAVVEKRLMLVEELRVSWRKTHTTSKERVSLRREELRVSREKKDSEKEPED